MSSKARVGFIGLGAMGASMAGHLNANGLLKVVANRSASKAEQLAERLAVKAAHTFDDF